MMNGPTMPRASQARSANEPRTIAASQPQAGTARNLSTKLDLGEAPRELCRLGRAGLDPDLGRGDADVPQHRVRDGLPARGLLERGDVELRGQVEVVLAADELERGGRHRPARSLVAGE